MGDGAERRDKHKGRVAVLPLQDVMHVCNVEGGLTTVPIAQLVDSEKSPSRSDEVNDAYRDACELEELPDGDECKMSVGPHMAVSSEQVTIARIEQLEGEMLALRTAISARRGAGLVRIN